jgi:hypothetical protein
VPDTNPSRTTESHVLIDNRRVDKEQTDVLGSNGEYQPSRAIETETIQVSPTTTRTFVRTYTWDANKKRSLVAQTEEISEHLANGDTHAVRTTFDSDVDGNLHTREREVADTTSSSSSTSQVQTTKYLTDGTGDFTPYLQTREVHTRAANQVQVTTTTLQPSPDGWKASEISETTIQEKGAILTSDQRQYQADLNGNQSEVSRTVNTQTKEVPGEQTNVTDTYSVDVPGIARDNDLHLIRRLTSVQRDNSSEKTTEGVIEEADPNQPKSGLRVTSKANAVTHSGPSGTQQTKSFRVQDENGAFDVIATQTRTVWIGSFGRDTR